MMPHKPGSMIFAFILFSSIFLPSKIHVEAGSLNILSSNRQDELKAALWGGDCWVIACSDMEDTGSGTALLESAMDNVKDNVCHGGSLKCLSKLSSGKTILQRLKFSIPPKGHPLLFIASNGQNPKMLKINEFAKIKENKGDSKGDKGSGSSATPDAKVLSATITKASLPIKPSTVTTNDGFKAKCLDQRHCLLLLTNSTANKLAGYKGSGDRATSGLAETLSSKHRTTRVLTIDVGTAEFSLSNALPSITQWPKSNGNGLQDFFAPRVLYLRRLSSKEGSTLSTPKQPHAAISRSGEKYKEPVVSSCSPQQLLKAANQSAASVIFEDKKLSPRQWASLDSGVVNFENLVFAVDGSYLSWKAASHWMIGHSVFASPPSKKSMQNLALKYPLIQPPIPKWGARAFRPLNHDESSNHGGIKFSSKVVSEWVSSFVSYDIPEINNDVKHSSNKKKSDHDISLVSISNAPKLIPNKNSKQKATSSTSTKKPSRTPSSSPSSSKSSSTKKQSSSTTNKYKGSNSKETGLTGAEKRRRRLAEKAELKEQALREAEVRRKMDLEAEDFLPTSPDDEDDGDEWDSMNEGTDDDDDDDDSYESVEVDGDGSFHWDDDDLGDDDEEEGYADTVYL